MPARLTAQQIDFYRREGYLLYDQPVLPAAKFASLREHFERRLALWSRTSDRSPEHMDVPHFTDPKLFEWVLDAKLLDVVESIIGPDIALFSTHFICKPPAVGKRVPWHEDAYYWRSMIDPVNVVTLWLAIDPSYVENGCMRVIPQSHQSAPRVHGPALDPNNAVLSGELPVEVSDESRAVDCILEPNHCSLHDAMLVYGSNANNGTMRRCGYTMRFMPTTVKFLDAGHRKGFQIDPARGKDRAGNVYGDPSKVNEAWLSQHAEQRRLVG